MCKQSNPPSPDVRLAHAPPTTQLQYHLPIPHVCAFPPPPPHLIHFLHFLHHTLNNCDFRPPGSMTHLPSSERRRSAPRSWRASPRRAVRSDSICALFRQALSSLAHGALSHRPQSPPPVRKLPADDSSTPAFSSAAWGVGDGNDGGTGGARRFGRMLHPSASCPGGGPCVHMQTSDAPLALINSLLSCHQANRGRAAAEVKRSRQAHRVPSKEMVETPGLLTRASPHVTAFGIFEQGFSRDRYSQPTQGKMKSVVFCSPRHSCYFSSVLEMLPRRQPGSGRRHCDVEVLKVRSRTSADSFPQRQFPKRFSISQMKECSFGVRQATGVLNWKGEALSRPLCWKRRHGTRWTPGPVLSANPPLPCPAPHHHKDINSVYYSHNKLLMECIHCLSILHRRNY